MDERKKKMLMIGGVVALAVVIIIAAAVMMDHKKKVEQSPMIVHTTTGAIIVPANTPVSTLATTGAITIPVTTQGVTTTIPVTTRAVTTTIPATTQPPRSYLQTTDGNYLVVNNGERLAVSKNIQDATPLAFVNCPTSGKFCLRSLTGLYITIDGSNIVDYSSNLGLLRIFITDLSGSGTLGVDGYNWEFDMAMLGFVDNANPPVWKVVQ